MRKLVPLVLLLVGSASLLACHGGGGGGSGGAGGSGGFTCAPPNTRPDAACTMCVENNCASEYQTICDNHCSAPGMTTPLTPACQDAVDALGVCIDDHCPGCDQADSEGGSGGTGGAGGSSAGGGAGGSHSGGSGGGAGSPGAGTACLIGNSICNWYPASTPSSMVMSVCTNSGGVVAEHCPDGPYGCCVQPTGTICYYNLIDVEQRIPKACGTAGGQWTTTPP